jgi:hypothetical protein
VWIKPSQSHETEVDGTLALLTEMQQQVGRKPQIAAAGSPTGWSRPRRLASATNRRMIGRSEAGIGKMYLDSKKRHGDLWARSRRIVAMQLDTDSKRIEHWLCVLRGAERQLQAARLPYNVDYAAGRLMNAKRELTRLGVDWRTYVSKAEEQLATARPGRIAKWPSHGDGPTDRAAGSR